MIPTFVAEQIGACSFLLHQPFHFTDAIFQSGITDQLIRAPRKEDACIRIQGALSDVTAETVHAGEMTAAFENT